ncbi:signal peptidase I [Cardinium endosymbiont of Culicoides punctatus]|uniref:signal peptidase I n=1 Tax=Cardinium endosymbiont of Culicoides punctatus TaxID=2304601 RepID=UPI00105868CC|nr:signal peptidase I [Cardinium endosymbiont of Culicoides punctatus]TDG95569.1 Signal peptidase I [Cardinium endosymbiont of Culicoides punctatus]
MKIPFLGKKRRQISGVTGPVNAVKEWINSILFAAIAATLIRWMVISLYVIPSGSMESTLLTGDFVLVSKLHYGARTPVTPLQVPLSHQTIIGTKTPSYLDWIQLPQYRLPGLGKVKRNDIIIFNTPVELDKPVDLREYWIKRCIALPGDFIYISHKQVYVNDQLARKADFVQYLYFIKTKRHLSSAFFEKNGFRNPVNYTSPGCEGYAVYATPEKVNQLTTVLPSYIQSVEPVEDEVGIRHTRIYPWNAAFSWTKDNFGPVKVPERGMTIQINETNITLYGFLIERYEGKRDVKLTRNECWINDQQIYEYTFNKNYYFAMGDNRDQSCDSRLIGFIPEDHIVGKAVLVLLSSDRRKSFFSGIRWNRLFHSID